MYCVFVLMSMVSYTVLSFFSPTTLPNFDYLTVSSHASHVNQLFNIGKMHSAHPAAFVTGHNHRQATPPPIAPVHRLPIEILVLIFTEVVRQAITRADSGFDSRKTPSMAAEERDVCWP